MFAERVSQPRVTLLAILALAVPVAFCASKLGLDLWYDEAYTLDVYVSSGFGWIVTSYAGPNNHVFYSLILYPFWAISDANAVLRLPSLIFSVATLYLVCRLVARNVSPAAAVPVVLWLGLNQMFLNHTMQVRGYGLSMSLAAALFAYAVRPSFRTRWYTQGAAVAGMACFLYTIPTNLLFFLPLAAAALVNIWAIERKIGRVVSEGIRWAAGAALAIVFYAPIIREVLAQRAPSAGWAEGARTLVRVFGSAAHDAPWLWAVILPGLLLWWRRVRREGTPRPAAWPTALAIVGLGPFLMQRALRMEIPYDRVFCPVLPIWALVVGWMVWEVVDAIRRSLPWRFSPATAGLVGGLALATILLPRLLTYPTRLAALRDQVFVQDGYYCYYAADFHPSRVIEYLGNALRGERSYLVVFDRRGLYTLPHYARRAGLPLRHCLYDETGHGLATLYYVVPRLALLEDVSERCGVSVEYLQKAREVADLGYFRVFRMQEPIKASRKPGIGTQ